MKKSTFKDKALPALLLAILLLVAATFSGLLWFSSAQLADVKSQNARLQTQNTNLASQRTALQNQTGQLQISLSQTQQSISELKNQSAALENQNYALQNQIIDLQSQVAAFQSKATNLTTANLVTALGVVEVPADSPKNFPNPLLYNHLYVDGSVTNNGSGIAYNAGLRIEAYTTDGSTVVNLTVPLVSQVNWTGTEVTMFGPVFGTNAKTQIYGNDSLTLGSLGPSQTASISFAIFHEGVAAKWTITPVWTDSP
jgi:hypothetical protein